MRPQSQFWGSDRPKERNLFVGVIYGPPKQSLQEFINDLDLLITRISKEDINIILWPIGI